MAALLECEYKDCKRSPGIKSKWCVYHKPMTTQVDPNRADSSKPGDGVEPVATKSIPVKWRTCNCGGATVNGKEFYMEDGIIRTLLELGNPDWKHVKKKPCDHWQETTMQLSQRLSKTGADDE